MVIVKEKSVLYFNGTDKEIITVCGGDGMNLGEMRRLVSLDYNTHFFKISNITLENFLLLHYLRN
jgi:hypothetical protein